MACIRNNIIIQMVYWLKIIPTDLKYIFRINTSRLLKVKITDNVVLFCLFSIYIPFTLITISAKRSTRILITFKTKKLNRLCVVILVYWSTVFKIYFIHSIWEVSSLKVLCFRLGPPTDGNCWCCHILLMQNQQFPFSSPRWGGNLALRCDEYEEHWPTTMSVTWTLTQAELPQQSESLRHWNIPEPFWRFWMSPRCWK